MNILVCIKPVPELIATLPSDSGGPLIPPRSEGSTWQINRYDEYALEMALGLKEKAPETTITVASVGETKVLDCIRRAFGMGADYGILIETDHSTLTSPCASASHLTDLIKKGDYDLILTGIISEDGASGCTGPYIAGRLNIPLMTSVVSVSITNIPHRLLVQRKNDEGSLSRFSGSFPMLMTCQMGAIPPRYPTLSGMLKAQKKNIEVVQPIGFFTPPSKLTGQKLPKKTRNARVVEGDISEKAQFVYNFIMEKGLIV